MDRLSLKGMLKKENRGDLHKISEALRGLVSSLEVFQEVEIKLLPVLETAAQPAHIRSIDCRTDTQTSPDFLRLVAGTLKEMVGKLVSDIEARPEIQKLLLVIQKSMSASAANDRAILQEVTNAKQQSSLVGALPSGKRKAVCMDSTAKKRAAVEGLVRCRHLCKHHPELMDPVLWSTLPQEVVELVFARLPIAKIINLCSDFKAWSTMSRSSNFRRACSERHPKLFGLVGRDKGGRTVCNVVYDIKSDEWIYRELGGFPRAFDISPDDRHGYDDSMYACDGGLVCFVPQENWLVHPILVGNPLTDEWKALPRVALQYKEPVFVQLVMDEDTKCYRVILVWRDKLLGGPLGAQCYDSRTCKWSKMDSGLVYGGCNTLLSTSVCAPCIFDCTTSTLFNLSDCSSFKDFIFSMVKDRLFVLHKCDRGRHASSMYKVSEYAWQSGASELSRLSIIDSTLSRALPRTYGRHLFSTSGFVLLIGGNHEEDEDQHQLMRLYDLSTKEWLWVKITGSHRRSSMVFT